MHYTKTYRLPQWEKSDRIMMEDFNAAMAGIESGIEKTDRDAAGYAAQVQANAAALAGKAQAAADAAMDAAQAAQQTADNAYCPGNVPYTVGSYAGNGTEVLIDLGYQPHHHHGPGARRRGQLRPGHHRGRAGHAALCRQL